jgi:long-subunit acyl-CoA synthetase (AMP-forming)
MSMTLLDVADAEGAADPLAAATVCAAFQRTAARHADRPALRTLDGSLNLTWAELAKRVERLAAGLAALGVGHGNTVAIVLPNVPECHVVDFAAVHLGAVPFTIYNSSTAEQVRHQLDNADARVVVTQRSFLDKIDAAARGLDCLEHVVVIDGAPGRLSLADVEAGGSEDFDFESAWQSVDAEDLVTMIYTSGTTGPPKGAQWAHRTVMAQQRALDAALPLPSEAVISFLPMAHAGGRITAHYMALAYGACITACPDLKELPAYLAQVRPDALFAVPRLWEKLQVALEGIADEAGRRALVVGVERMKALDGGTDVARERADELAAEHEAALGALRPALARLGLDRIKAAFVGGAPVAPEVVRFFRAAGVPLLEAYGLTEGSLNVFNRIEEFKTGTAGRPLPGVELKLAADGEILVRGELNFVGYRKEPEKTAEALDSDGWLHTGDVARVDEDGYVTIVDRKREIIINAAGKNMSPANIESAIKGESSLIGQVVCIGDRRRYNTALVTLDPEAAPRYAERLGVAAVSLEAIAAAPEIQAEIAGAVERGNQRLARVEQIKKFKLLSSAWLPDSDELTPTLKLKRKPIAAKYAAEIEALYADD